MELIGWVVWLVPALSIWAALAQWAWWREKNKKEELLRLNRELYHKAIIDDLTGVYNVRYLHLKLREFVQRARRYGRPFVLAWIDLDCFKQYNDTFGHLAGDQVLKTFGSVCQEQLRIDVDFAFRYGGDEFALLLAEVSRKEGEQIMERLQYAFKQAVDYKVGLSYGLVEYQNDFTPEDMLRTADELMYQQKKQHKAILGK
ncbi:GGDEF domain-containing protein [Carboxydocella sp. JDF658]|uniref:GGDEF domain-containing protein n=1 Tax=Carboxydocella sp. JDF658 TaxID=1926600 RepID=UPI0009CBF2E0|nr:GGDEF domain-containing protein [Carboxydocella sp. JDF658]GAW32443.1 GGDEF domain-containing protein [Carboxydocella sp. JDF658]